MTNAAKVSNEQLQYAGVLVKDLVSQGVVVGSSPLIVTQLCGFVGIALHGRYLQIGEARCSAKD